MHELAGHVISIHAPHARSDEQLLQLRRAVDISIHAPHARSDITASVQFPLAIYFNPRSSCEERPGDLFPFPGQVISIHAPHARSDDADTLKIIRAYVFQSTLLMRGATSACPRCFSHFSLFQSTLLMRGATAGPCEDCWGTSISIHAPHARSDTARGNRAAAPFYFNPRSSCEERHHHHPCKIRCSCNFNPRSSCEERLFPSRTTASVSRYFNPRSSCEERPATSRKSRILHLFQSTLLMRGATLNLINLILAERFQSTLLMRGATLQPAPAAVGSPISIHAPHARSDLHIRISLRQHLHISIHAPHARSDDAAAGPEEHVEDFNPRSSCEERLRNDERYQVIDISIHAPHARSDLSR